MNNNNTKPCPTKHTITVAETSKLLGIAEVDLKGIDHQDERFFPMPDAMNQYVAKCDKIKRGDIVHLECLGSYRNDGIFIWDGQKMLDLESNQDDYGNLPQQFKAITEFPIDYFHWNSKASICHNSYVWFDPKPVVDQIMANWSYGLIDEVAMEDLRVFHSSFKLNGVTYRIIGDTEDVNFGEPSEDNADNIKSCIQAYNDLLESGKPFPFRSQSHDEYVNQDPTGHTLYFSESDVLQARDTTTGFVGY